MKYVEWVNLSWRSRFLWKMSKESWNIRSRLCLLYMFIYFYQCSNVKKCCKPVGHRVFGPRWIGENLIDNLEAHNYCVIMELSVLQISRSIGDVYLKKAEFNKEPLYAKFRLRDQFRRPILSAEPSITVQELQSHDQFLIFASDGLWEHLSNQEAVDIVQNHPHNVRYDLST